MTSSATSAEPSAASAESVFNRASRPRPRRFFSMIVLRERGEFGVCGSLTRWDFLMQCRLHDVLLGERRGVSPTCNLKRHVGLTPPRSPSEFKLLFFSAHGLM